MDPEREEQRQARAGSGRPAEAGRAEPAERATAPAGGAAPQHPYTAEQKLAILRAFAAGPESMRDFCARQGLTTKTLCTWRKRYEEAVEAYATSGLQQDDFCRVWGIGRSTLSKWLKRYAEEGAQGLETRRAQRRKAPPPNALPEATKEAVRALKRQQPRFGLRRIRDWLFRHEGKRVSASSVKNVLVAADLHAAPKPQKKRRKKPLPRRFERARPRELWQTDITSFVLPRSGRRLYLTVFLDDHSRYIVSWALATLGVSVSSVAGPQHGWEVVALLERVRAERGCLPLVLATDNGSENVNAVVSAYLRRHRIVHLRNLPRTPQHNAWAERAVREVKEAAGCRAGEVADQADLQARLDTAVRRLNARQRPSRGWRTAEEMLAAEPPAEALVDRGCFYAAARSAVEEALRDLENGRARRMAERSAILQTLVDFNLIRWTRGGIPLEAS